LLLATAETLKEAATGLDDTGGLGLDFGLGLADAVSGVGAVVGLLEPQLTRRPIARHASGSKPDCGMADLRFNICGHVGHGVLSRPSHPHIKRTWITIKMRGSAAIHGCIEALPRSAGGRGSALSTRMINGAVLCPRE
jgi:hypothetical protein